MTNRQTIVKTNEHTTPKLYTDLGLPQGSPLSSILYLFYNADLLDDCAKKGVDAQGYIDDITLMSASKTVRGNTQKLAQVHNQVCESWRAKHGSEFSLPKYQLIHISRKRNIDYTAGVRLRGGHLIKGMSTAINLGISFESKLSWKNQISKIKEKAIKSIAALTSITGSTWGGSYLALRKIFKAVIIPQITYGASIWHTPTGERGNRKMLVMQLAQVQALGARLITGAFRATSTQALNIEAYPTPIGLELDRKTDQTAACLCSGPLYHTLTQGRSTHPRRIPTPLEVLKKRHTKLFGSNIHKLERRPAYIVAPWWEPPAVDISGSKEKATQFHNEYLESKPSAEIVAYTDGSGINEKIGSSCVIHGKTKAIKKFLGANTCSTVYMGELQGIEDSLSYTLSQDQSSGI